MGFICCEELFYEIPHVFGDGRGGALLGELAASADVIDPVGAVASSAYTPPTPTRVADNTINGLGLTAGVPWATQSSSLPNTMWLSTELTPTITWDLGAVYSLTGDHLWNSNEGYNGTYALGPIAVSRPPTSRYPPFQARAPGRTWEPSRSSRLRATTRTWVRRTASSPLPNGFSST